MKPVARELLLAGVVVALMLVFAEQVRRSDQLPTPPAMIAWIAPPPPSIRRCGGGAFRGTPPIRIEGLDPHYPLAARRAHAAGDVTLSVDIDENGAVINPRIVRSIPQLDRAALDAVRQWRFSPAMLDGVPACVTMALTVRFQLLV